jgi:peptidoglycan/LPS O-acetylase OafA/YrhL
LKHENNFNALRLLAAWLVIVGHSFELLLQKDPFHRVFEIDSLGGVGVVMFFAISGYLVTQSRLRIDSVWLFLWRRALRIFPALWLLVILSVFFAGPLLSRFSFAEYFASPTTYTYLRTLFLQNASPVLPGVFENNPLQPGFNGSLWTLPIEAKCYLVLAVFGLAQRRWMKPALGLAALGLLTIVLIHVTRGVFRVEYFAAESYSVGKLVGPFVMGAIIACWRLERWLAPTAWIVVMGAVLFACTSGGESMTQCWSLVALAIGGLTLSLGLQHWPPLAAFTPRSDYSYGLYLYAFPIQQALIAANPAITPWILIALTTTLALVFAVMSWHVVERPFLALKATPSVRNAFRSPSTRVFAAVFAALLGFTLLYGFWRMLDQRVLKSLPANDPVAAIGYLDTPLKAFRAGESVRVVGWVWHPAGVRSAQLIIGGKPISRVALFRTRLDVSAVHTEKIGILHGGFEVQIRNTDLSAVAKTDAIDLKIELHNGSVSMLRFGEIP